HNIAPIDLLAVNLYPFEATVAKGADFATCIENIDIGGPCMIRASAKNFLRVASVTDPGDYDGILSELQAHSGAISLARRFELARKAFAHTAAYDSAIAAYFGGQDVATIGDGYQIEGA
ncbi:MAG: bifunctional phosphoribosylaminoimidazolecarboxamide formyltransferase/IMP cyclohydrolase, partial [Verrucomicrobia bacterium]|nr:bifunctional phosphoribosylaminoimidazolecarboxamide formyltransferase/IMP cyclohydrolase [Verrucomicrobiota bacterium]